MGSKRAMLLNGLGEAIAEIVPKHKRFIDLFAGSACVAWHVAQKHDVDVLACDLQAFSVALASGVISRTQQIRHEVLDAWIQRAQARVCSSNRYREAVSIQKALDSKKIADVTVAARHSCQGADGPILSAYGGYYFSPLQAMYIDALRSEAPKSGRARHGLLAALIWATSRCAAAPGHTDAAEYPF